MNTVGVYKAQRSQASHIFVNEMGEIMIPDANVLQTLDGEVLQEIYHR